MTTTYCSATTLRKGDTIVHPATGQQVELLSVRRHPTSTIERRVRFAGRNGRPVTLDVGGSVEVVVR